MIPRQICTLFILAFWIARPLASPQQAAQSAPSPNAQVISVAQAIALAQKSEPGYAAAVADHGVAKADRTIARAALLPQVHYNNQVIYTQPARYAHSGAIPAGDAAAPRFIANNAVHEYVSQGVMSETVGADLIAAYRKSNAAALLAEAKLEVARRGLVVTVIKRYYDVLATDHKRSVAEEAAHEGDRFFALTNKLEQGREVAHADVVKAHIQQQQRQRELADIVAENEKAKLELGVLLFPDPRTPYDLDPQLQKAPNLPTREQFESDAAKRNPELRAAMASLRVAQQEVSAAQAAFLPSLSLDYAYGIDAPQFATNSPEGLRNLGYAMSGTVNLPVWDWFATPAKLKQSKLRRTQAEVELTAAQRQLVADIQEAYTEAATAQHSLASLEQSEKDAAESLRLTDLRYRAGESTVLEVVDAENTLVQAQNARVDGSVRFAVALSNMQLLTGNLVQ